MRTLRRTVSTIALVGTVSLALSACGWFRGDEEAATTGTTTTMTQPTTTAPSTVQRQPTTTTMEPVAQSRPTEQEYQQSLQK